MATLTSVVKILKSLRVKFDYNRRAEEIYIESRYGPSLVITGNSDEVRGISSETASCAETHISVLPSYKLDIWKSDRSGIWTIELRDSENDIMALIDFTGVENIPKPTKK